MEHERTKQSYTCLITMSISNTDTNKRAPPAGSARVCCILLNTASIAPLLPGDDSSLVLCDPKNAPSERTARQTDFLIKPSPRQAYANRGSGCQKERFTVRMRCCFSATRCTPADPA